MGLPGTKPVADRSQVRRANKPEPGTEWREVEDVPFLGAPALPARDEGSTRADGRPIGIFADSWPAATTRWYRAISRMPHAVLWNESEWEFVFSTAETHARFTEGWRGCATGSELRMKEKLLGMTHDARRDLRIRYVPAKTTTTELPDNVTQLDDFRGL